ncbi:hypothetical protein GCM10020331_008670 [Ectobacillus funiculus]
MRLKSKGLPATLSKSRDPIVQNYFELVEEIEKQWQDKKRQGFKWICGSCEFSPVTYTRC